MMTTLRCCVIDDEPLAAGLIGAYVERTPSLELAGVFNSAQEAFPAISAGDIDLLFLDIQMPQLSGIEFVNLLPSSTMVVFVSAFENYAIQGIKANAVDYLLKPVSYDDFLGAVNRASQRRESSLLAASYGLPSSEGTARERTAAEATGAELNPGAEYIIVKSEYRYRQIAKSDILYIEGLKDYVRIFIEGENRSIMTLLSLKALEHCLPEGRFMRIHRSFIVNLSKIKTIERNKILIADRVLTPGTLYEIPVGDSYRPAIASYISSLSLNPE